MIVTHLTTFMQEITSAKNPRVQQIIKLRSKAKLRKAMELSVLEGSQEINKAVAAKLRIRQVFICSRLHPDLPAIPDPETEWYDVTPDIYEKIAVRGDSEGIIATFSPPSFSLNALQYNTPPLLIIVENVEKPGNLGAILRTADACGAHGIIVLDPGTDLYNPNVIRASLGCAFTVPMIPAEEDEVLRYLRDRRIQLIAATPHTNKILYDLDLKNGIAVAVGTEHDGLSQHLVDNADMQCKIPMYGEADSLNVSVSTAIILYEAVRQRNFKYL